MKFHKEYRKRWYIWVMQAGTVVLLLGSISGYTAIALIGGFVAISTWFYHRADSKRRIAALEERLEKQRSGRD